MPDEPLEPDDTDEPCKTGTADGSHADEQPGAGPGRRKAGSGGRERRDGGAGQATGNPHAAGADPKWAAADE